VSSRTHELVARQYQLWNEELLPQLAREDIRFLRRRDWSDAQKTWIQGVLPPEIMPMMTPIGLDPAHPFPAHPQQEPQFRRATVRQGCVRPQFRIRPGAGAARPATGDPAPA